MTLRPQSYGRFHYLAIIVTSEWCFLNHLTVWTGTVCVRKSLSFTFKLTCEKFFMHIPFDDYATTVPFSFDDVAPVFSLNHVQGLFTSYNCFCVQNMMHLAVVTCLIRKKVYFRAVLFSKDTCRNRVMSIITVNVVNDVHTYIHVFISWQN